jgi:hypothetical protein
MERAGAFYERYAWVLLIVPSAFGTLAAVSYMVFGLQTVPDYVAALPEGRVSTRPLLEQSPEQLTRIFRNTLTEWGIMQAGFGVLAIVVAAIPFRRNERWAWFALWILPLSWLGANINAARLGMTLGPLPIGLALAVVGLLLPVRLFFGGSRNHGPPRQ